MAHTGRPWTDYKPPPPLRCGRRSKASAATTCCARRWSSTSSTRWAARAELASTNVAEALRLCAPSRSAARQRRRPRLPRSVATGSTSSTTRRGATSSATARLHGRPRRRRARPAGELVAVSPTRCAMVARRDRSRTTPKRSTCRWWRARSRRCGDARRRADARIRYSAIARCPDPRPRRRRRTVGDRHARRLPARRRRHQRLARRARGGQAQDRRSSGSATAASGGLATTSQIEIEPAGLRPGRARPRVPRRGRRRRGPADRTGLRRVCDPAGG